MKTKPVNKFVLAKQQSLAAAHRAALRPIYLDQPEVRNVLKCIPAKLRKDVSVSPSDYSDNITFYLTVRDLPSFKDKALTRVLEAFAGDDWSSCSNDYTYDQPNRDFVFTKTLTVPLPVNAHTRWLKKQGYIHWSEYEGDAGPSVRVEVKVFISAYVKSDSPLCRVEVVERKETIVIEEVKRIVCA
jgi:hypothetical protein